MKKIIREVKENIVQCTTIDERFYIKSIPNEVGDQEQRIYYPSVTWISEFYPKGIAFFKWLAQKGWDEAEAIKIAAGDKGSKVHYAIGDLLDGVEVKMDSKYVNPTTEEMEELTLQEYECLMSFVDWYNTCKPVSLAKELLVFNEEYHYAGTIDYICRIDDQIWIIDFKTGQNLWPSHKLQVSAYSHADFAVTLPVSEIIEVDPVGERKLAILQLGYRKNKKKYKFTEVEDCFDLFLNTKDIWENETKGVEPRQVDYPMSLKLEVENENQ